MRRDLDPVEDDAQIIDIAQRLPGPRSRVGDTGIARPAADGVVVRPVFQRLVEDQPRHIMGVLAGRQKSGGISVDATGDLMLVDVDAAAPLALHRRDIANQFSVGLSRMARLVKERMSINSDPEKISLDDLVNARTVSAVIQPFLGSSQLSQFMDQTNPLAELTNKRRLSALGPGGLTRERAGLRSPRRALLAVRPHVPIETPEGPNIGLITQPLDLCAINELGFIETPYRVVKNGRAANEVGWLSASEEEGYAVAQANAPVDETASSPSSWCSAARGTTTRCWRRSGIDFMDVAPEQLDSIAAALIPFLEHDDANRALMGSNMQRQSVPLLFPQAPLVGTGLEEKVARDWAPSSRHAAAAWNKHAQRSKRRRSLGWPTSMARSSAGAPRARPVTRRSRPTWSRAGTRSSWSRTVSRTSCRSCCSPGSTARPWRRAGRSPRSARRSSTR